MFLLLQSIFCIEKKNNFESFENMNHWNQLLSVKQANMISQMYL